MAGYKPVTVVSDARGNVDLEDLKTKLSDDVAALMLTNPSTLGLFEENIVEIARLVHDAGGLLYYDGANSQRDPRSLAARRHGLRHRPLQHAQDVLARRTAAAAPAPVRSSFATSSSPTCRRL